MAWSIKNYNAWIKRARKASRIDLATAREAYRIEKQKSGGPLRGVDVARRKTFKDSITAAQFATARKEVKIRDGKKVRTGARVRDISGADVGGGGGGGSGGSLGGGIAISSVESWDQYYDDFDFYEPVEIDSSADYGEV